MMTARSSRRYGVAFLLGAFLLTSEPANAAEACDPLSGRLASLEGTVELQRGGAGPWNAARLSDRLCKDDTIRTGRNSRAAISLANDAVMRLDQQTTLKLLSVTPKEEERSLLNLILGAVQSFSRKPRKFAVNTPYLNATIEGTEFVLRVAPGQSEVTVFEGTVIARNDQGRVSVTGGEAAAAQQGRAPVKRIAVRPRDAVQWALYYPPVLAAGQGRSAVRRAAGLLNAGRVAEARAEIDRAIAGNEDAGAAHALRAVINVAQNRKDPALADAQEAVRLSPRSAAARIALSYAQQAHFRLDAARDTLRQAVTDEPNNALAWARLSELWLMLGERGEARRAAQKATAIAPNSARAQTVLGFAALTELRTETAAAAFDKAIATAPSDPLPRLGLGLAKIRGGNLEGGRKDIEIAVSLDSQNALLRAYLGKAYFEEKRDPLDAQQLAIAKQLDANDPTAYLYDAIRKQTENNPGGALRDLQDSIARNDNRAVYRGRLQLDQDRAARGTSLARVYNDLGFTEAGVNEASKSLSLDPGNAAAHRFLSDNYRNVRRREIARVSELLQAQLLQDVNINPVQPSISETNLNIGGGGGPAQAGFNEFTPLFERNETRLDVSGLYGNNKTWGGEGVVSATHGPVSLSAGAFHYETDGYRESNSLEHDIFDFYAQVAVTPDFNIQAEIRRRDSVSGDQSLNFNPDQFDPDFKRTLEQKTGRIGLRYSPTPGSDFLISLISADRHERRDQVIVFPIFGRIDLPTMVKDDGRQGEAQYLYKAESVNVTAGAAVAKVFRRTKIGPGTLAEDFPGFLCTPVCVIPPLPAGTTLVTETTERERIGHERGYLYINANLPSSVTWTIGGSVDNFKQRDLDLTEFNPKLGVQWDITKDFRLRGAAFKVVKPVLATNATLEPTQIAGFNQWFDDVNATVSRAYGVGLDWRPTKTLFAGVEVMQREYEEPILNGSSFVREDRDESVFRGYVNWSLIPQLSTSLQIVYDRFSSSSTLRADLPTSVDTLSVPFGVRYFAGFGLFAGLTATYVDQTVERDPASTFGEGTSKFVTVDAMLGYRLPNRRGVFGIQVVNLLDRDFKYQDDGFREFRDDPASGPYFPERTILARMTLSF